jgi:hypothetical protein
MCRSRAGSECGVVIGVSDLKFLSCTEHVLCRYVITEAAHWSIEFPRKINEIERIPSSGLTNMNCPVAVQCRQNLLVEFGSLHDGSVLSEGACR